MLLVKDVRSYSTFSLVSFSLWYLLFGLVFSIAVNIGFDFGIVGPKSDFCISSLISFGLEGSLSWVIILFYNILIMYSRLSNKL